MKYANNWNSLRALCTDTIDLYQFHSGNDAALAQDDLWQMLQDQVQAGKVRYLGLSISSRQENLHQVQRAREIGVSTIQLVYNRLDRQPEERVLPACTEKDLGVLARVPLASGLLSGKYAPGQVFTDANDVRSTMNPEKLESRLNQVEDIRRNEVPAGMPMATWALAWCLRHPAVTCVIPGNKTVEQLEANAQAADAIDDIPHPSVEAFWQAYLNSLPQGSELLAGGYSVWHFCDNEADADKLAQLARDGIKTATCGLLSSYEAEGEDVPQQGDFSVVTNWAGQPICVVQTVEVELKPFDQVDAAFAYDEGEGNRSYEYWRQAHWRAFTRECQSQGQSFQEDMPVVCEQFRTVFP